MAAYMEPWQHVLPRKMFAIIGPVAQRIASRTYSLRKESRLIIDRSWKKW